MKSIHPAVAMPFADLLAGLEAARATGMVSRKLDPNTGRALYVYTQKCVYERGWTPFSMMARGLILAPEERRIVALPFGKFFNFGENEGSQTIPEGPFEVYEKLDGSLAIIHHHGGRWRAATKGAFDSGQAQWTEARLGAQDVSALVPGVTYLAEAIYPENRIVVRYDEAALVMLAAYDADGAEVPFDQLRNTAAGMGWRTAERYPFASFSDLISKAATLTQSEEGYVIRWESGLRMKIKGAEYRRIHAMISRCTPLALWEALASGMDIESMRQDLPEEFWADFDAIVGLLRSQAKSLEDDIVADTVAIVGLSDKDLGLTLAQRGSDRTRPFLFGYRKTGAITGKGKDAFWRMLRPAGNKLAGYQPSRSLEQVVFDDS